MWSDPSGRGPWVNFALADGSQSPYAANLIGNLKHWLDEDPEVAALVRALPGIRREPFAGPEWVLLLINRYMAIYEFKNFNLWR